MDLDAVGRYFVGAEIDFLAVPDASHQPAVIHLEHVHVDFVVSHLLQMLHAVNHRIEHAQPPIDITLK